METPVDGMPLRFDLRCISYDDKRGIGGEELEFKNVTLTDVKLAPKVGNVPDEFKRQQPAMISLNRNPQHRENKTKNLRLANGQIRKIHIRFITHFNGQKILY